LWTGLGIQLIAGAFSTATSLLTSYFGSLEDAQMERRTLDRREFTLQSAMAILSAATITISGCGGGGSSPAPSPGPAPGSGDATGSISGNHGHTAVITAARLMAGNAIQLDIRGQADHPHTVDLTAAEITQIGARQQVVKSSSNDAGHQHTVTFN
jgi:hypothetical protein